jgi:hypothetical protein
MHRHDVDSLLEEMTPEQFNQWWAYCRLEPWGYDYERSALIAAMIHNCLLMFMAAQAGREISEEELISPGDLMPFSKRRRRRERILSDEEAERLAAERYG